MHPFVSVATFGDPCIDPYAHQFCDAASVAGFVGRDAYFFHGLYPRLWHLGENGRPRCETRCSSCDGLRSWPEFPNSLYGSREQGLATRSCPNRWLIVEPWWRRDDGLPGEGDVACFLTIKEILNDLGVELLDAVLVSQECGCWWSMRELTTGSSTWSAV